MSSPPPSPDLASPDPTPSTDREEDAILSLAELARLIGAPEDEIRLFLALGLLRPREPDTERFERGDESRTRLLRELVRSGVDPVALAEAEKDGRFSLDFAGDIIADPAARTATAHADALAEIGLDPAFARRMQESLGLPFVAEDAPIRTDDLELFQLSRAALVEGVDGEALLRVFRVFGIGIRHIVEAQRDLYRENVEDPLIAAGISRLDLLRGTASTRLKLQRLGYRAVFLLLRRLLEQVVYENVFARIEEGLLEVGIRQERADAGRAIVFLDLSGFTSLTESEGDAIAADHGGHLLEIVQEASARYGGRVVKTLGDGVMLHFREIPNAVSAALEVVGKTGPGSGDGGGGGSGLPPARAGIAAGPVVLRDGDYFGRTVNLAARLVGVAATREVWVSQSVRDAFVASESSPESGFVFQDRGSRLLKGLSEKVPVWAVTRSGHS